MRIKKNELYLIVSFFAFVLTATLFLLCNQNFDASTMSQGIKISLTPDKKQATAGDKITYDIQVKNTNATWLGENPKRSTLYISQALANGSNNRETATWEIQTLPRGTTTSKKFTVTMLADPGDKNVTKQSIANVYIKYPTRDFYPWRKPKYQYKLLVFDITTLSMTAIPEAKNITAIYKPAQLTHVPTAANALVKLFNYQTANISNQTQIDADYNDILQGELQVTNQDNAVVEVSFPTACQNPRVTLDDLIFRLPKDQTCPQALTKLRFTPHETKKYPVNIVFDSYVGYDKINFAKNSSRYRLDPAATYWLKPDANKTYKLGAMFSKNLSNNITVNFSKVDRHLAFSLPNYSTEAQLLNLPIQGPYTGKAPAKGYKTSDNLTSTTYFFWYDYLSKYHMSFLQDHPVSPDTYSWRSVAWQRRQLEDMMYAGIDIVLPVFAGNPPYKNFQESSSYIYNGLATLVAAEEDLIAEGKNPPKIGLFYDTSKLDLYENSTSKLNNPNYHVDLSTDFGRAWFYTTIRDFYSVIPPNLWASVDGRPIIYLYGANYAKSNSNDNQLKDYVVAHFQHDFSKTTPRFVADLSWKIRFPNLALDNYYLWGTAVYGLKSYSTASFGPGYNETATGRRNPVVKDRQNGNFYIKNWENLLAQDPNRRVKLLMLETWNEFHEGTDIAESKEYGRKYLDLTAQYSSLWKQGARLEPKGIYQNVSTVSAALGQNWTDKGLKLIKGGPSSDNTVQNATAGGSSCIETISTQPIKYITIASDDSFFYDDKGSLVVSVEYFDEGRGSFSLQYDSSDINALYWGAYKSAAPVALANTMSWKTATFTLADARFVNRQNSDTDFRLLTSTKLKVRKISVSRQ